jgi:hypothetical protein
MKLSTIAITLLTSSASAAVVTEPASNNALQARQQTGSYTISGLGQRKRQVTAAGANSFNLAIAMLETERMDTNYAYGDNKQNDSANFGIFKQNWGLLRECCGRFKGQSQSQWNNGAVLKYAKHYDHVTHLLTSRSIAPTSMLMCSVSASVSHTMDEIDGLRDTAMARLVLPIPTRKTSEVSSCGILDL